MGNLKIWDKEYGMSEVNGKAVVSSRKLAEIFKKRHDHILRDIENAVRTVKKLISPNLGRLIYINYSMYSGYKFPDLK